MPTTARTAALHLGKAAQNTFTERRFNKPQQRSGTCEAASICVTSKLPPIGVPAPSLETGPHAQALHSRGGVGWHALSQSATG